MMGCDIHAMVEYKEKGRDNWRSFGYDTVNLGRDYSMFTAMANVRNYGDEIQHIEPKGIPKNVSWSTADKNTCYVVDECGEDSEYTDRETAERWVKQGTSEWVDERKNRVTHPDWHSHSYLSSEEFELCLKKVSEVVKYDIEPSYFVALAMLKKYEELGCEARLVFWFDN